MSAYPYVTRPSASPPPIESVVLNCITCGADASIWCMGCRLATYCCSTHQQQDILRHHPDCHRMDLMATYIEFLEDRLAHMPDQYCGIEHLMCVYIPGGPRLGALQSISIAFTRRVGRLLTGPQWMTPDLTATFGHATTLSETIALGPSGARLPHALRFWISLDANSLRRPDDLNQTVFRLVQGRITVLYGSVVIARCANRVGFTYVHSDVHSDWATFTWFMTTMAWNRPRLASLLQNNLVAFLNSGLPEPSAR
ncbi:hypothetical protein GLOTRDRAFT_134205 [Gloeophyllum trabeum ATCC 11539]|uniref:MYND-type domain-containing protein n=1 Tax=Gloeophyllum trabeum (strain ATCC 11539 / FP-39264 / Madison 617) TaxID=670483 RepID=S7R6Z3_GLOTA|nr:uncharacterized protein GLOTRDRAFT_134205 [Gloeophyllum trabeum ATCC 11539]EPQ50155.1 hypothetical protein GLOTRDRAFT_134205 [Gloeophyllum trabeum ATCC 11539]